MSTPVNPPVRRANGRPSSAMQGTFGAAHRDRPERCLGWSDGAWSGDTESVMLAQTLCATGFAVPLTVAGPNVAADASDPVIAVAVIHYVLGRRVRWSGTVPHLPVDDQLPPGAIH